MITLREFSRKISLSVCGFGSEHHWLSVCYRSIQLIQLNRPMAHWLKVRRKQSSFITQNIPILGGASAAGVVFRDTPKTTPEDWGGCTEQCNQGADGPMVADSQRRWSIMMIDRISNAPVSGLGQWDRCSVFRDPWLELEGNASYQVMQMYSTDLTLVHSRPLSRIFWKIRLVEQKFRLISGLAEFLR